MEYIYGFLFVGFMCLIGQIILDNTKLTSGHITTIFVILGTFLGFLGFYDKISLIIGPASFLPIISFGNSLYNASFIGFTKKGFLGIFDNLLTTTSAGIVSTIVFSFVIGLAFKPKN